MKKFSRNDSFGGRRDSGRPQMYRATCDQCGSSCEVPFRPSGDKPVLCSHCFGGKDRAPRREREREEKRFFKATCDSCGSACEVPFKPTPGKPVYCDSCFGKDGGHSHSKPATDYSEQLNALNAKLDKLMDFLLASKPEKKTVKKVAEKAKPEAKAKPKAKVVKAPAKKVVKKKK